MVHLDKAGQQQYQNPYSNSSNRDKNCCYDNNFNSSNYSNSNSNKLNYNNSSSN